ncbi:MAG: IS21 family transposase [Bacteroidales bacterium]|nr:IS21 family transposase [Bacteroidales bacterium]
MSNRAIHRQLGYGREKISEVWSEYNAALARLNDPAADIKAVQEEMYSEPKYDSSKRTKRKYTSTVEEALKEILDQEEAKTRRLGPRHKQKLTNKQIHEQLVDLGHDIGRVTINNAISVLRKKLKEVYIRQHYDFGDRLEYDFGEVLLDCGKGIRKYHMAVFSSPASNFRWAYLYTNQKQTVFQDSHVRFFEMIGGVWKEVVYDNMRNVVHKFIGRNEKELNKELVQMAQYYGYMPNVTNCFKANEKGHVESSVQILRNQIFASRYKFTSLDEASAYMAKRLEEINEESRVSEEKEHLGAYRPPLELAKISENTVDSYSMIVVDTCKYSVPEYFACKKVIVKKYHDEIRVYAAGELICSHKRVFGKGSMSVDIYHYLGTLLRKPGAVRNSVALKSIPKLKAIFDTHYAKAPKKFIETFIENKDLSVDEIVALFEEKTSNTSSARAEFKAICIVGKTQETDIAVRADMLKYAALIYNAGPGCKAGVDVSETMSPKEENVYAINF